MKTSRILGLWLLLWTLATASVGGAQQAPPAVSSVQAEFRRLVLEGRRPVALAPQLLARTELGNNQVERVRFQVEQGEPAVALIYRPKPEGKYPPVVVQHFLGGTKDHLLLAPLLHALANRGFMAVAIDGRYRGERQNGKSLEVAMVQSLRSGQGRPFLLDTVYDVTRLLDYLETRPDADPKRVGMTGISEGGLVTWMTAAVDPRIQVAAPVVGVTRFADLLELPDGPKSQPLLRLLDAVLKEHAKDLQEPQVSMRVFRSAMSRLLPGIPGRLDADQLMPLIAPRPLLILCHEQDEIFPVESARKVHDTLKMRYRALQAEERLDFRVTPGLKHSGINQTELLGMMQWLEKWLRPGT